MISTRTTQLKTGKELRRLCTKISLPLRPRLEDMEDVINYCLVML
jgi:hypothetical protein